MENKKKLIILSSIIIGVLVAVLGFTYALFTFDRAGTNQELVLGDIWMKYEETNGISLEDALPGAAYSKYFEFTVTGKNTYTEKDIWYDVRLTKGDIPEGKTEDNRIEDKYLKFKLVEVNDEVETEIFTDKTYNDLTNQIVHVATIPKSTNEYSKTYRLYMVISEELKVGNTEGAISSSEFETLFGSIKVATTGDFTEKEVPPEPINWFDEIVINNNSESCPTYIREDGITYISGTKDCINFNYVWYSGKLWRITAIYPDGTMKMITEDAITAIAYGTDYNFYTDESTSSWIYQWLNEDFLDTLYNYENIIVTDATWNVTSGDGTISTKLEETTMVSAKVGLLNSYEYYMAYKNASTSTNYLNIGYYWWLSNRYSTDSSNVWSVSSYGYASNGIPSSSTNAGRPVVNLKSTIQLAGGTGIKTDPYRIKGDKEDAVSNTTLLNTRSSGEYVNFDGETYRIVGIENDTTKINKVDYVRDDSDAVITKYLASSTTFGKDTNTQGEDYWDYYLNNTWYDSISSNYKSMLEKGTYYLGTVSSSARNYKLAICASASNTVSTKDCTKTSTTYSGYVGLPRYGEMFSSQLGSGYSTSTAMWLITPYSTSYVWNVNFVGNAGNYNPSSYANGVRPSINLKSTIKITGGDGTESSPFEISL